MAHCQTLIDSLRQRGYRITPQREMVIEAIAHSNRHITAEEVFDKVRVRTRAVNIATVYRTLDLLVEEGLISRADLGEGCIVYASAEHGPHVHLVCRQCGHVIEADASLLHPLVQDIQVRYAFDCGPQHFGLSGLCEICRSSELSKSEVQDD